MPPPKKGEVRNPNGHSKQRRDQKAFSEALEKVIGQQDGVNITRLDVLIHKAVKHAEEGDSSYFKEILNRAYGKVADPSAQPQTLNQTNIQVNIKMDYVDASKS